MEEPEDSVEQRRVLTELRLMWLCVDTYNRKWEKSFSIRRIFHFPIINS